MRAMSSWLLMCSLVFVGVSSKSSTPHLTTADKNRLLSVFTPALKGGDIATIYHSVLGYQLLDMAVPDSQSLCAAAAKFANDASIESVYAAAGTSAALKCPIKLGDKASEVVKTSLSEGSNVATIFFAAKALTSLGTKLDSAAVGKALASAVKKDDSLLTLGLSFHVASLLEGGASVYTPFFDRIEDVMVQADEVDGRLLQFEGGLSVTSVVLTGAAALANKAKKPLPVTGDQIIKFANYLISRKSVQQPKGAFHLLDGVEMMSTNSQFVPLSVSLTSSVSVSSQQPEVLLSVTDLRGKAPEGDFNLVVDSAVHSVDGTSLVTKKQLTKKAGSPSVFSLNLMELKPTPGFYELQLTATPAKASSKFVGNSGVVVNVKVLTTITLAQGQLKLIDNEQSGSGKNFDLKFPSKLKQKVAVDYRERIQLSFAVQDGAGANMMVHQAFVRFAHKTTGSEIIYVAEAEDGTSLYKFDLDLSSKAAEFQSKSGDYAFTLVIGDAVVSNPVAWDLADLTITFPETEEIVQPAMYQPKPQISHLFREPEARPSKFVSDAFTLLCLSPFLLLVILWIKLGVNVANFPVSISSLGFHTGLGSIFVLYLYFWMKLNMFETVKYLVLLGIVTFLCGNSLLSSIANKNKQN